MTDQASLLDQEKVTTKVETPAATVEVTTEAPVKEVMPRTIEDQESLEFQIMDQSDEDQIIGEIKGMMSENADKWIYQFPSGGKTVTGLSWVGTKEFRYWLAEQKKARITEVPELGYMKEVDHDGQKYLDCKVVMKDLESEIVASATVRQAYKKAKRDGTFQVIDVEFVPRIAESKAQRNAIQKIIPASALAEFIAMAKQKGKVQILVPSKEGLTLTDVDFKLAEPLLSHIEKLTTIEDCREYWKFLSKQTSKYNGRIMHNVKSALQTKADKIKEAKAKSKIKEITSEKKEGETDAK